MGRVYYDKTNPTLCNKIGKQDFHNRPAEVMSKDGDNNDDEKKPFLTPFMIADRGDCSFVQKVRNMEDAGVAVAIVVDNTEEDIS